MMLRQIQEELELEVATHASGLERAVEGGYASDLLSCVMSRASQGYVWVTLQSHINVVAVASLLGLAGVIVTEGQRPDDATLERAEMEGVTLLLTPLTTFDVVGVLSGLGIQGQPTTTADD